MLQPDTLIYQRYRIVRLIGQGGMGAVYEAIDQRLGNRVAVKETLFSGGDFDKAFEREAKLLAAMRHPALPKVTDYFTDGTGQFLVMEFIPGHNLGELMTQRGAPFPIERTVSWVHQILCTLEYLHGQQPPIIHRDIKPQNLKLLASDQIVLLDFGLAKGLIVGQTNVSVASSVFGYTPNYAPPEQIYGTGTDTRSDIYAVGATLYHLLTGIRPADALRRAAALIGGQPDPLLIVRELNVAVPDTISVLVSQTLSLDSKARPPSAYAMRIALERAMSDYNAAQHERAADYETHVLGTAIIGSNRPPYANAPADISDQETTQTPAVSGDSPLQPVPLPPVAQHNPLHIASTDSSAILYHGQAGVFGKRVVLGGGIGAILILLTAYFFISYSSPQLPPRIAADIASSVSAQIDKATTIPLTATLAPTDTPLASSTSTSKQRSLPLPLPTSTIVHILPKPSPSPVPTMAPTQPISANLTLLSRIDASSILQPEQTTRFGLVRFDPAYAIDGDPTTSWVEGVEGAGTGERVTLTFPKEITITRLGMTVGFDRDDAIFFANHRVHTVRLLFSDNTEYLVAFDDRRGMQYRDIPATTTQYVAIVIESVYRGKHYEDTPIAEIQTWGYLP